jgi:hypothetical protein
MQISLGTLHLSRQSYIFLFLRTLVHLCLLLYALLSVLNLKGLDTSAGLRGLELEETIVKKIIKETG